MKLDGIEPAKNVMDKAFRFVGNQWPEALHKNLELPGKFVELLPNDVAPTPASEMRLNYHGLQKPWISRIFLGIHLFNRLWPLN